MGHQKFDINKLEKLNDPGRFDTLKTDAMWEALGAPDPRIIVEIGAGTGMFAEAFTRLAKDAKVYAVDTESLMVEWMHAHRPEVSAGRIVPVLSHETKVPLNDAMADLVVMINVHHELAEPEATYLEAWRLLSPGGQLLAVDWAPIDTPRGPSQAIRISAEDAAVFFTDAGFTGVLTHDTLPWHWMVTGVKPA
jgi:ubiquinone/menaquinone biosynthesis C-methylase UbiE